jgi:cell division protein FtsI (penicillin-binding protein 3)
MTSAVARPHNLRNADRKQADIVTAYQRMMSIMVVSVVGVTAVCVQLSAQTINAWASEGEGLVTGLSGRNDIVDRNGIVLARTIEARTLGVHPNQLLNSPESLAPKLAALMPERTEAEYLAILKSGKNFVYLRRRALPELVAKVNALGEPAMAYDPEPERLYPQITLAAHVLGYTDLDGRGVMGMERVLDEQLRNPALRGAPVALSLDMRVQAAMESELSAAMTDLNAQGATGLVLDVATGEIISMVSLPVFNPNNVGKANPESLRNNVTQSVYELGSIFKPLTMANAIDSGVVTNLARRFDATEPLSVGPFKIKDDHPQRRWLNIPEALVHSSNIVTARVADEVGRDRSEAFFTALGFREPVHVELKERGRTLWPESWGRAANMTIAYGHGIAVTPLHVASAYAAIVNGGTWRPATLRKLAPNEVPKGKRIISAATSVKMRQMLRMIVMDGTGRNANVAGFRVGGKTGTAEKPGIGGYSKTVNVSTFVAVFPMDKPRYVVVAMLDAPKGSSASFGQTTAAWTAAPVVAKVIARTGPMLGVYPDQSVEIPLGDMLPLLWKPKGERG